MLGYNVNFNFTFTFGMLSGVKTGVKRNLQFAGFEFCKSDFT